MVNIFVTGATGNVGLATIDALNTMKDVRILAGVRNIEKGKQLFDGQNNVKPVVFDFAYPDSFKSVLKEADILFLLRPPQLADVERYFRPVMEAAKNAGIKGVVFLSVQGAEKSKFIPHHKIEKSLLEYQLPYVFLRPGYFMQNLTTTLLHDIRNKNEIFLPAGRAKFNWVDVNDIAEIAALVLTQFSRYENRAIEITGEEQLDFFEVARILSGELKRDIKHSNPNVISYILQKRREGIGWNYIFVMLMLHYLPRFQKTPALSDAYFHILGKPPGKLREFIQREKGIL